MADLPTAGSRWSNWQWNARGYWYASRISPNGVLEYDYRYADADQNQHFVTPRTPGPAVQTYSYSPQSAQTNSSADTYTASPSGTSSTFDHDATPKASYADSSPISTYRGASNSMSGTYNQGSTWPNAAQTSTAPSSFRFDPAYSTSYTAGYTSPKAASSSIDAATQNIQNLSLGPLHGVQPQRYFDDQLDYTVQRHIFKAPNSGNYEELDPRYKVIDSKIQDAFYKVGRVFMMLWTEPAAESVGGTRNGSHFSTTFLGGHAYSEIRRFVVVAKQHGNSICCPIQTYSGQATLKDKLPDADQHAVIYTSTQPPALHSYVASDGSTVTERLTKDPIKVTKEQTAFEGDLDPKSRLNYSKIYTVEHYVRVLNIGMVHRDSITTLMANCPFKRTEPSQKPVARKGRAEPKKSRYPDINDPKDHKRKHAPKGP